MDVRARTPAERIRSIGTVRPVRTLVGSFRMRQRGNPHKTRKTFYPKRKKDSQSCLRRNTETADTIASTTSTKQGSIKPALWRRSYIHTLGALPFLTGWRGKGRIPKEKETARFPILWPPSPARHVALCFEANSFSTNENPTDIPKKSPLCFEANHLAQMKILQTSQTLRSMCEHKLYPLALIQHILLCLKATLFHPKQKRPQESTFTDP